MAANLCVDHPAGKGVMRDPISPLEAGQIDGQLGEPSLKLAGRARFSSYFLGYLALEEIQS